MHNIFIGRQPIFDRNLEVYAYELLFRSGTENRAGRIDGNQATSSVILNAFVEIGLDDLVGPHPAFINLTRQFLVSDDPLPFPKERVVLELLEDIQADAEVIGAMTRLTQSGYRLALDDFVYHDRLKPLINLAYIVKIDLMALSSTDLERHVQQLRGYSVKLLAEKIETQAQFEHCKELGFDYFQGYFLSKPSIVQGQQLPPNRLAVLQLLAKLQDPESAASELEQLVSRDVGLSYKLLRYINSAFFAFPKQIDSIRQAVVYLGMQAMRTWVTLLVLAGMDTKPSALVITAMQRAKMCELLAGAAQRQGRESYFTVGLFSMLEALMDVPLKRILASLPFTDDIHHALLELKGPYGEALRCVLAYEQGDWPQARFDDLSPAQTTEIYLEATRWADQTANAIKD